MFVACKRSSMLRAARACICSEPNGPSNRESFPFGRFSSRKWKKETTVINYVIYPLIAARLDLTALFILWRTQRDSSKPKFYWITNASVLWINKYTMNWAAARLTSLSISISHSRCGAVCVSGRTRYSLRVRCAPRLLAWWILHRTVSGIRHEHQYASLTRVIIVYSSIFECIWSGKQNSPRISSRCSAAPWSVR